MAKEGSKFLKYGCFGCLGVLVFLLVVSGAVVGVATMQAKRETVADRNLEQELSAPPTKTQVLGEIEVAEASGEQPLEADRPLAGTVHLSLSGGEFQIARGASGAPIRVEAKYSKERGELVESFTEATDEQGWRYELEFQNRSGGIMGTLRQIFGGVSANVKIYLPPDVPYALELHVQQGGADIDLGDLWLTEGNFEFRQGGVNLEISEPLKQPMKRLRINGSMGGFNLSRIGNASPEHFIFDGSMGGMNVDLKGAWKNDSNIEIDVQMGGGSVSLPRNVILEGLSDSKFRVQEPNREVPLPTLRFDRISGELQFTY